MPTAKLCDVLLNVATTCVFALSVTLQVVSVPQPAPPADQPPNALPAAGVAVSVTLAPPWKLALHVAPQLMPAGFDVTVPEPVPFLLTVSPGRNTESCTMTNELVPSGPEPMMA